MHNTVHTSIPPDGRYGRMHNPLAAIILNYKTLKLDNMDFEMMCENIARKIFQCGRFDDPLGRLANTDYWSNLHDHEDFSEVNRCRTWAVLSRLQNEYLDSVPGREELYEQSTSINEKVLSATSNKELYESMIEINKIVETLGLSEFPHIDYQNTNDKKKQ